MATETINKPNPYSLEHITPLVLGGTKWRICSVCGVEFSDYHIGYGLYGMCSSCSWKARNWKQFCKDNFEETGKDVLVCSDCGVLFFYVWGEKKEGNNLCSMGHRGYSSGHYPHPRVCRKGNILSYSSGGLSYPSGKGDIV